MTLGLESVNWKCGSWGSSGGRVNESEGVQAMCASFVSVSNFVGNDARSCDGVHGHHLRPAADSKVACRRTHDLPHHNVPP